MAASDIVGGVMGPGGTKPCSTAVDVGGVENASTAVRAPGARALGVGTDLVHVPTFAAQLGQPGTKFASVFTDRELALARQRPGGPDASLAGRWAAKESVIKAWSGALWGSAPTLDQELVDWSEIEVISDRWHRPQIRLRGQIHHQISALVLDVVGPGATAQWLVSTSHDGDYALAFVTLQAVNSELQSRR